MTIVKLPDPRAVLAETDWDALDSAFPERGSDHPWGAVPSTPVALAALTSGDREAVAGALFHLADNLLHQGTIYGQTGPAALYVAALLADPGSRDALTPEWEAGRVPLRLKLLDWLAAVADLASDAEEARRKRWVPSWGTLTGVREVRALRPALFPGVSACFADGDPDVREAAIAAAVPLLDAPELVHHRATLAPVLRSELAVSSDRGYRFAAVRGLRSWGEDTSMLDAHTEMLEYEKREAERRANFPTSSSADEPPF
ncbi:hypothetical protein AB0L25_16065 [Spirillospora sp. NPDC052242]